MRQITPNIPNTTHNTERLLSSICLKKSHMGKLPIATIHKLINHFKNLGDFKNFTFDIPCYT
jgi:hypothetical protein